jgi:phosphoenolpyruvate-protein kinase (PTS system EI component)
VLSVVTGAELSKLRRLPAGILAVDAAPLSHVMIRLFGAGIPTVILGRHWVTELREGDRVVLDGSSGLVCAAADFPDIPEEPVTPQTPGRPVMTSDGVPLSLRASVASTDGAARALALGAESIGLVRSEYLMPEDGSLPHTGFYRTVFTEICRAAAPLAVRVRLLDLAADKRPLWLPEAPGVLTALGLQGSRLFDREPISSLLLAQLDALGHIAANFDLSLLVPFISGPEEFLRWREEIRSHLPISLPIGAMAETPAAVLGLPELLEEGDFVGIGCNDLLQCLFAADRDLPAVADLVDPYAPAVYRLLGLAARSASGALERVQLCGILPQLPGVLPVLIGLGFRSFSMEPLLIPRIGQSVPGIELAAAAFLADAVCAAPDAAAVRRLIGQPEDAPWGIGAVGPRARAR